MSRVVLAQARPRFAVFAAFGHERVRPVGYSEPMPFENAPSKWRISSGARVKNLSFMRRAGLTAFSSRPQLSTDGRGLATNLFQSRTSASARKFDDLPSYTPTFTKWYRAFLNLDRLIASATSEFFFR